MEKLTERNAFRVRETTVVFPHLRLRFQGFKVSRFQGFKVSRFQGFKVSGFQGSRIYGFKVSRFQGLKGVFAKNERGYWLNAIKKRF